MSGERDEKWQDLSSAIVVVVGFVAFVGSSAVAASVLLPLHGGNAESAWPKALIYGPVLFAIASSIVVLVFRKAYRTGIGPPLLWVASVWAWPLLVIILFLPGLRV